MTLRIDHVSKSFGHIEALVDVKGIGRWTAEMFLMFHEMRANVLPVDDIGLQKACALHYFDGTRPTLAGRS